MKHTYGSKKFCSHSNSLVSSPHQYVGDFQLEKCSTRSQTYMLAGSCIWSAVSKYQNGTPKVARKAFNMRRSGTQYVAMVTELLSSYCGAHLVEPYCKKSNISDTNWLRYLFSSYVNKIWLSVWRHHLANLHILKLEYLWNEKRYLKIVNSIFLLMQSTFLCFKMA